MNRLFLRPVARRATLAVALATATTICLTGCSSLSGSSSCKDYLNASSEDQQKVVNDLAQKYDKPDYTTPLGFPEVAYACTSSPTMTLDQFFEKAQ